MNYNRGRMTEVINLALKEAIIDLNFRYNKGILTQCEEDSPSLSNIRPITSEALLNDTILVSSNFIKDYGIPEEISTLLCENKYIISLNSCIHVMNISAERLLTYFRLDRYIEYRSGKLYYRPDPLRYEYDLVDCENDIKNIFLLNEKASDFCKILSFGVNTMIGIVRSYIRLLEKYKSWFKLSEPLGPWYNSLDLLKFAKRLGTEPSDTLAYIITAKEVGQFIVSNLNREYLSSITSLLINRIYYK